MARKQVKAKSRKEDKLRPYRVDYFDIDQMIDNDRALIRSQVVRAVTSAQAQNMVSLNDPSATGNGDWGIADGRIVIRSYRYYKNLGTPKRDVYKAVEDLFTSNKAVKVMEQVEAYRKRKAIDAQFVPTGIVADSNGHRTRFSDSSLYDEVCISCGATDTSGKLNQPCPQKDFDRSSSIFPYEADANAVKTGPSSPATQAVVADLAGMTAHDAHEQVMDTFVANPGQTDISKFDLDTAAPVIHPAPESGDEIARALAARTELPYTDPDHVCSDKCIEFVPINDPMPGTPTFIQPPCDRVIGDTYTFPLWGKLLVYGAFTLVAVLIVLAILHCGK